MKITPVGAAGGVTGSCLLIEANGGKYLVDCGMFQGRGEDENDNRRFPFEPAEIDAVFLTHAHLDHCGRLPLLHARGFRGCVYATAPTCDLAQFILLDSAKIQVEDAERSARRSRRQGLPPEPPLYDEQDVLHLLRDFRPQPYRAPLEIGGLQVIFHQSGHILGSAAIEIRDGDTSALFSGDLGMPKRNVVPDPDPAPECDLVFCESTYGDRLHRSEEESVDELLEAINWAYQQGGNVVIPSFAMERAQDILFHLHGLRREGKAPKNPVYLDSPLAANITRVYQQHPDDLDDETRAFFDRHKDPFQFAGLQMTRTAEQSRGLNGRNGIIVIAGSGMCNGGRVLHHLKHNLWREDSAVVFVGFQAKGTLGRRIIERASNITIDREPVVVRARTFTINGFSAHADQSGLVSWLSTTGRARIVLNHGEPDASAKLAEVLNAQGRHAEVAVKGKVYDTEAIIARA
ncbi:MAG: MBL fold metallo-hydrolase [Armatimonadota bacterium]